MEYKRFRIDIISSLSIEIILIQLFNFELSSIRIVRIKMQLQISPLNFF